MIAAAAMEKRANALRIEISKHLLPDLLRAQQKSDALDSKRNFCFFFFSFPQSSKKRATKDSRFIERFIVTALN